MTLDTTGTTGKCTARTITPTIYLLKANVTGTGTPPGSLTFKLTARDCASPANESLQSATTSSTSNWKSDVNGG